jgi:LmbE family N-acetylglucosaminyl deacetylase
VPITRLLRTLALVLLAIAPRLLPGQERGATALGEAVAGLDVTVRVLLIGAHPDDEDTQLLTWLARGRQVETAYLSLTRGDGGQNLIGNELGPVLGMIRTEELLAARRLDGGRQYFTRAYDFGFSKTAEETYTHWPKDSILKDVVTVVRAFKPHIIVAVFSGTPRDGHGHHQVSGILAREAFDAAADTVRFPRNPMDLGPWTPLKFYRAARFNPTEATLAFNVGELSALRGRTYAEIASESRSQHLSQGFGVLQRRGTSMDYLKLEASRIGPVTAKESSLLDGIPSGWSRFADALVTPRARAALDSLPAAIAEVRRVQDLTAPAPMVAPLARVTRLLDSAKAVRECDFIRNYEFQGKPLTAFPCAGVTADLRASLAIARSRAEKALLAAAGVLVEATVPRDAVAVGDSVPVTIALYNQGGTDVRFGWSSLSGGRVDSAGRITGWLHGTTQSTPWWLAGGRRGDVFVARPAPDGSGPIEEPAADFVVGPILGIGGTDVFLRTPVIYRSADPARGERRYPLVTVPAISVTLDDEVEYARAGVQLDRVYNVRVRSTTTAPRGVSVALTLPAGLRADTLVRRAALEPFGSATLRFHVRGMLPVGRHVISATATSGGETYVSGYVPINYEHIRPLRYYRPASVQIEAVNASLPRNTTIAYISGVGDNVAPMLSQLGISVTTIAPDQLAATDLSRYGAVVVGPRAFAASDGLAVNAARLQDYARAGGTVVVQYGQTEMQRPGILPYPITLAGTAARVTDEHAPVRVLDPGARLLASPNRIGPEDFANWVQERSVYMPSRIDPHYHTLLEMHDPGEPPNEGAVLVAPLGRGAYVYTTLALFRQLPAGVPGAARIFLNLLAADGHASASTLPRP